MQIECYKYIKKALASVDDCFNGHNFNLTELKNY